MFTSFKKALRSKGSPVSRTMSMREPRAKPQDDVDSDDSLPKSWAKKVRNNKNGHYLWPESTMKCI